MKENIIKVGFCVSYDWEMLKTSIPLIYKESDIICLSIDKNRKSWKGNKYDFDNDAFYTLVKKLDTENKIDIYEDDFSQPNLNARENGNLQRTKIAERMGKGGWHIQIDSDEYFLDFASFVKELQKIHPNPTGNEKPLNVCACWVPLIKKTEKGFLFVDFKNEIPENAPFASNVPQYERARHNGHFNVLTNCYVIHETWARSSDDLWYKINNWGHSAEELDAQQTRLSYFNLWKSLDEYNYQYVHNFHPAQAEVWPALGYAQGKDVQEFFSNYIPNFPLSPTELKIHNNRNIARIKHLLK
ncbi:MAG: hypothetical protein GY827_09165 [Cytophagales bacterium]|nr:hypothetical protein [Cytophagales bacterium]